MSEFKKRNFVRNKDYLGFLACIVSILFSIGLSVLPVPHGIEQAWPLWTVLVLIFWVAYVPDVVGPVIIWIAGLLYDVVQGSLLGEHAFSFLLVYLLTYPMRRQIKIFSLGSQLFRVGLILLGYQISMACIQGGNIGKNILWYFVSWATSLLLWPWILFLMHAIAVRFYVHRL